MAHTAIDILKEAILLEKRGQSFYSSVAEKTESSAARKIFRMMAEEEEEHIKFLSDQFKHYKEYKEFKTPETYQEHEEHEAAMIVLSKQMREEIDAASFEAAAINAAMDFEKRAVKLYSERAKEATDPKEKELYDMLAKWEMGHEKMLHEFNKHLVEDIWNDNNFWPF